MVQGSASTKKMRGTAHEGRAVCTQRVRSGHHQRTPIETESFEGGDCAIGILRRERRYWVLRYLEVGVPIKNR